MVATARRDERGVRVDQLAAVADIGRIVNLDIARQQIEGGLVFGLGLALGSATGYARRPAVSGRLASLDLPLLADCPEIAVDFIDSDAAAVRSGRTRRRGGRARRSPTRCSRPPACASAACRCYRAKDL